MVAPHKRKITVEAIATVGEDGKLIVQVPAEVEPGEHQVVVIIDEVHKTATGRAPLTFSAHDVGPWPEGLSLRREDMYEDWGR
jgi:hypothetical protein